MEREQAPAKRQQKEDTTSSIFSLRWTSIINAFRKPVYDCLHCMTECAARNPECTISFIVILSAALLIIGLVTNFSVDTETDLLWTPRNSKPVQHRRWIDVQSGFPDEKRKFLMFFHDHEKNIALQEKNIARAFEALDAVRNSKGYEEMCREGDHADTRAAQLHPCEVWGATKFWNNNESIYRTDDRVIHTMSVEYFPDDGSRVDRDSLFGYPRFDSNGTLVYAESFLVIIHVPDTDEAKDFEELAIDRIVTLDDTWQANAEINLRVEVEAYRSFEDE